MTKSAVQGYINQASISLLRGKCGQAGEEIDAGWNALQDYAGWLAAHGGSPAETLKYQIALAKLYRRRARCSGGRTAFAGPLAGDNLFPTLGFLFGVIGLGIGIGTIYKNS